MSRCRSGLTALVLAGLAAVTVGALHYAPGQFDAAPSIGGDPTVSAAAGVTAPLQQAGLVNGTTVNAAAVRTILDEIPPTTAAPTSTYDRDSFGPAWADSDRNGCDQRNDTLARDLTAVTYKPGTHDCVVLTGTLLDPYTGREIPFIRGESTSTAVQIDHMVPLSWAFQHGASSWPEERRQQLATDMSNLTAVDGPTNAAKSDQGPGSWLPSSSSYDCTYVTRFTYVVHRYELTIDTADRDAIARVLDTCK